MIIKNVMAELAARLATVTDINVFPFPPDNASPPAAWVEWPDVVTYDLTFGRGMDTLTLAVVVIVGKVSDQDAIAQLTEFADGSGTRSVKALLESTGGTYTAMDTVQVTRAEFGLVTLAGTAYDGAWFYVDIAGDGA